MSLQIRNATEADIPAITAIYAAEVHGGVNTYEYEPPDASQMLARMQAILVAGYPYLVAESDGRLAGYAYAGSFRARAAYRTAVESSIYVATGLHGRGIGAALLQRLIDDCAECGFRQMVAVIGDPANTASIRLHERLGFRHVGVFAGLAFKQGRWLDTVFMQRALGAGAGSPPSR